jgi:hypothetical protein
LYCSACADLRSNPVWNERLKAFSPGGARSDNALRQVENVFRL